MNKNIIIIAGAAVTAFLAVLLIPRLLDSGEDEVPVATESSNSSDDAASADGSGSTGSTDDKEQATASPAPPPASGSNPVLEAQLVEAVRQVNAGGPVVIDEFTTMASARAQGNRIVYRYEISQELSAAQIAQFRQFASTQNQQTICTRPETRQLIDIGGEIEYAYFGPGNRYLFNTAITGC